MKTNLSELMKVLDIKCDEKVEIKGISEDSRDIKKDWLFISRIENAREYQKAVIQKGGYVVCEEVSQQANCYGFANFKKLDEMINLYYGDLCRDMFIIGITGTSGKSSVADIVSQMLRKIDKKVMRIGSDGVDYNNHLLSTSNTTPSLFKLAYYFKEALRQEIEYIVMEVSSHAIDQNRIKLINFDMIVYTNITSDHLDYHLTTLNYQNTKFKLRNYLKDNGVIVINSDDKILHHLYELSNHKCITYGKDGSHFKLDDIICSSNHSSFICNGMKFETPLIGAVNVYNIAIMIVIGRVLELTYEQLQAVAKLIKPVPGRMEVVYNEEFLVWLDYAHSEDALKRILQFANRVKKNRIITLIGCGGERDQGKRFGMAHIAGLYSDLVIFTADNSRGETLVNIFNDMDINSVENHDVFENRYYAIKHAIAIAKKGDIIIIAGRGNESIQKIGTQSIHFSDREVIKQVVIGRIHPCI
ncbi:MAG: UDP-N-acetylmuramoyl-L-alanyl-D-glutamate--2,6-diaminopimelate ligase [Erysipelotrichaceae bacterium]